MYAHVPQVSMHRRRLSGAAGTSRRPASTVAGERLRAAFGFTLLEVTVTLAILALAAAVIVPALAGVSRAELRSAAGKLAGTVKATYDSAALGGRSYRLAFDFEHQTVRVEADTSSLSPGGGLAGLAKVFTGGIPSLEEGANAEEVPPPADLLSLLGASEADGSGAGLSRFQSAGRDFVLPEGIRLLDVWIEGMSQPASEGTPYLPFFAHGYTENALIHLTNEDGAVFTVRVSALTGRAEVVDSYVEVPK